MVAEIDEKLIAEVDANHINSLDDLEQDQAIKCVVSLHGRKINFRAKDMDEAMQYAEESKGIDYTEEEDRKLVRKLDWYILPLVVALMSCQLMDKTTNSYASIMGLKDDLKMVGDQYSWVGSSFYFGYLFAQFPINYLLQRFPLSKTLGIVVFIWGVILMCHAACYSYAPFIVCRVLLGCCEASMDPAYILLTSQYWKKSEHFMRTGIWFGFQGFGTILGAGISYGLATHKDSYSLPAWRLLYIITGVITIFLAIISIFHVPDIPTKAWFLNEREKMIVVDRIRDNQQGFKTKAFKLYQVKEAFLDTKTYLLFVYFFTYGLANGGFNNFGSILLHEDFGFSSTTALLMNMPGGAIDIIFPPIFSYLDIYVLHSRMAVAEITTGISLTGICMLAFCDKKAPRLVGYYCFYVATVTFAILASNVSSNVAGYTKKIIVNAVFLIGYATGNICGPQTFITSQGPSYYGAKTAMVVGFTTAFIVIGIMWAMDFFENKKRDKIKAELGEKYVKVENSEFLDLTDKENPEFRYSL
ncbi:allantoate permease [Ascoidea rubescens DSM 1968]|uniref:Putative allantoate permease n=1 Tax=Ascoidea rubescens DSM 1968 TaxID=1344418 RepID=A0A1D2VBI4_9ASCO|nr:putative allantoate permease [Ascoidea rubescens DSM 1968]ODV58979.1 putative allantoate permease [Ascoidea rubescens DSM 1968]